MVTESQRVTAATIGEIECIAAAFFDEARHGEELNFPYFSSIWKEILDLDRGYIFVVRSETGKISGLIGAICGPDVYTGKPACFPQFWYVLPEYRGRKEGLHLFREMEREAIERGSHFILPGHLVCINPDGMESFFVREGYELREKMYRKVLK